jgi:hypothetical protein
MAIRGSAVRRIGLFSDVVHFRPRSVVIHNIYQSHWAALLIIYTDASVTDQDEPSIFRAFLT